MATNRLTAGGFEARAANGGEGGASQCVKMQSRGKLSSQVRLAVVFPMSKMDTFEI